MTLHKFKSCHNCHYYTYWSLLDVTELTEEGDLGHTIVAMCEPELRIELYLLMDIKKSSSRELNYILI